MNKTLENLRAFSKECAVLPVWERRPLPQGSPIDVFKRLKNISRHCFILESLEDKERWGRWTFLGLEPKLEFSCQGGVVKIKSGMDIEIPGADPAQYLQRILRENRSAPAAALFPGEDLPAFTGGLVGYFSFEFVTYSVPSLTLDGEDDGHFKDCDLMLFDKLIAWDNLKSCLYIFVNIKTDALEENYKRALTDIDRLGRVVDSGDEAFIPPLRLAAPLHELFDGRRYAAMVERAKRYIYEGDVFQVVLANRLEARVEGSIFEIYRILRRSNPSPYMFYFSSDDIEIAGASPETLVRVQGGGVFTFPLAGTRKRGATPEEDAALERDLLTDPKELAEHNMLVDLGRNDIGKVCEFGSVVVEKYLSVERFSHVMHIGSTVRGALRADRSAVDAISAVLPAGTLSGAPKIRAIEIINELEGRKRGIYGGAIGYIGLAGDMDTCISIRIAYKKDGRVYIRSGAGIVADSSGENEYEECRNKMKAVLAALEQAGSER
ncbi:MAG: anthranilate synthase component I family protein [Spirochaetaceae bacterium]|jgi:anthranilate synthase component 1|nr:anthranilate synthase component I family protein [Spirochaetaceae bacterium]